MDDFERALVNEHVENPIVLDDEGCLTLTDFIRVKKLSYSIAAQSMFRTNFKYVRNRRELKI